MEPSKELAQLLGLSDHEARLYLAGLQFDAATLTELSKAAGIPRTAAYYPLRQLAEQGFMSSVRVGKRLRYRSMNIDQLQKVLDERKQKLSELASSLSPAITIPQGNFSVQYFPGLRGIEVAGDIFLRESEAKLWHTFEHPVHSTERHGEKRFDAYIGARVKRKIHAKTIVPASAADNAWLKKHIAEDAKELRETLIVSSEDYPIEASLATDGERVFCFTVQGVPFATLIHNLHIAQTFVSLHKLAWERYKK
jgi:sugar-specific transcriptional regulator TrmB